MGIKTAEKLAQRIQHFDLLDGVQLQEVWSHFGRKDIDIEEFKQYVLRRDLLTNYQIEHILAGDRTTFFYGDYKVHYLIGTGTFARVYRGASRIDDRQAAIKVLRKRFSDDKEQTERFYREGKMGMLLEHPNIVPIWDAYSGGSTHYIVMEFIEGRNLREFARIRDVFEPLEATRLILDVANGLDYAFRRGLAHRDMKLSNVLVSSRGEAKIVDFGLAGAESSAGDDGIGEFANPRTIDYAGLERATGVRNGDMRSDTFFLGCMYYQMLSGEAPISETRDRSKRLSRERFSDIAPLNKVKPDIPPEVVAVVNKAIEFDPEQRYQTPGAMAADLRKLWERLQDPEAVAQADVEQSVPVTPEPVTPEPIASGEGVDPHGRARVLMIVEGDTQMQDIFRERLKKHGYRVLVTVDPQRALQRFDQDERVADLVLWSTGSIGESALEAFNALGSDQKTAHVPAILLLGEEHKGWAARAETAPHRMVMSMPIKVRQLRETLVQLLAAREEAASQ